MHKITCVLAVLAGLNTLHASAALTVDRSRLVYNEGEKAIGINVTNRNPRSPYLAQGWMENSHHEKLSDLLMVLPPMQRVEAGAKTLVRIQAMPDIGTLPEDRESVFYFNLREIPPKTDQKNVLTLAMQTRLKVFYRPKALRIDPSQSTVPGAQTLTLTRKESQYVLTNPTPYHFSFVEMRNSLRGNGLAGFDPVMAAPFSTVTLKPGASAAGNSPVLMFVNDYGSQRLLPFTCNANTCQAGMPENVPLQEGP